MGEPYKWDNNREGEANMKERLDQVLATTNYCSLFPKAMVEHGEVVGSDHRPLFLHFDY